MGARGAPKTGGREKGSLNKTTSDIKRFVDELIGKNLSTMKKDLKKIEPYQRLQVIEKLLQYTLPKRQSVSIEEQVRCEYIEIERLLNSAPNEAITAIAERIRELNRLNSHAEER